MKFVNLDKIKIVQSHNFHTKELFLELNASDSLIEMRNKIKPYFKDLFDKPSAFETLYKININTTDSILNDDEADAAFQMMVNTISAIFFQNFCLPQVRKRERRLDVPENLKVLYANMSSIKKIINQETYNSIFNLEMHWTNNNVDFHYYLLPEHDENKGSEEKDDH